MSEKEIKIIMIMMMIIIIMKITIIIIMIIIIAQSKYLEGPLGNEKEKTPKINALPRQDDCQESYPHWKKKGY